MSRGQLWRRVSCVACGERFTSAASLRSHWLGGWQPLWMRAAIRHRRELRRVRFPLRLPQWCECEEFGQSVAVPCARNCPTVRDRVRREARARRAVLP